MKPPTLVAHMRSQITYNTKFVPEGCGKASSSPGVTIGVRDCCGVRC
jgi:hypothetical protein